jgi:hypothetical protein
VAAESVDAAVDVEVMSNEERVVREDQRRGGRVKQRGALTELSETAS